MRLTVDRDPLNTALAKAQGTVVRTTTMPILQHLLLRAKEGVLTVVAADPDMQVQVDVAAAVEEAGAATAAAGRLHDIVRNLSAGAELALGVDGPRVTLKCGRSRFQLPSFPEKDFPTFEGSAPDARARIEAADLRRLIDRTAFAASRDAVRYYMGGVRLHPTSDTGRLRAVSTDGSRLALAEAALPEGWAGAPAITIPLKAIGEIRRLLEGAGGDCVIWTNGRLVGLEVGSARLVTKLIDGSYPDYSRVIPRENSRVVIGKIGPLTAALKRCVLMAGDKSRTVSLALQPGQIVAKARDGEGGEAEESVPVEFDGEPVNFSFNGGYLAEVFAQMSGDDIRLECGSIKEPMRVADPADAAAEFVIMPLFG